MIEFLAHPGPVLLDVKDNRTELMMPPHDEPNMVLGTMLYGAKAVLSGRVDDVAEMLSTNLLR